MSLLVTSCTMGKQPDRLLNKGPQYLRTRTNASLFVQKEHRKSAVELLAASKSQFYNAKESVSLDKQQDLAVSAGQSNRYKKHSKQKDPPRSKSEYDLSELQLLSLAEDESDANNNDTSDECVNLAKTDVLEGTQRLSLEDNIPIQKTSKTGETKETTDAVNGDTVCRIAETSIEDVVTKQDNFLTPKLSQPKLTTLHSASKTHDNASSETDIKNALDSVDGETIKKPVPRPRKFREKPVPPPRRHSPKTPHTEGSNDFVFSSRLIASAPYSLHSAAAPKNHTSFSDTPKLNTQAISPTDSKPGTRKKHSLVESLTQRFTALSAAPSQPTSEKPRHFTDQSKTSQPDAITPSKSPRIPDKKCTFTATPVFIGRPETTSQIFQAKPVFISGLHVSTTSTKNCKISDTPGVGSDILVLSKGRKRCPDVPVPTHAIKRERKSVSSDISGSDPDIVRQATTELVPVEKSNSSTTSKSEMSIESVGQAVYESDINAIPTATMESDLMQGEEEEAREVTRANSSLSGKMEPQDSSPLSLSPTPYCSTVPRSHSDISCRLEGQHSRDSSIVSNHSRLSRASAGADLENFFNQMGLERGVLEPISRLKELQTSEIFDSMSSLDSQDAASICSTYSRSEQEWSDTQSMERSQQQTSIVERNARIIKWLCNVRKAKTQPHQAESATAGKA